MLFRSELIAAIVEMKHRNPKFGCVRIAQQISYAFGIDIDKDVVRRYLKNTTAPIPVPMDHPGWLSLATPRIASGVSICSVSNRSYFAAIGYC